MAKQFIEAKAISRDINPNSIITAKFSNNTFVLVSRDL